MTIQEDWIKQVPVRDPRPKPDPNDWWICAVCRHMHSILAAQRWDGKCCDECKPLAVADVEYQPPERFRELRADDDDVTKNDQDGKPVDDDASGHG